MRPTRKAIGRPALLACLLAASSLATAQNVPTAPASRTDALASGFADPPNSARPRVWWHWMNGNVTKDGIRKDLDWMSAVGLGGLQNFDASLATPQVVENRLVYMTPEWKDAFRYAVGLAEEKGLEFTIAASPGWSETGGPWVKPEDGMKKLVWSETVVPGGRRFTGTIPPPPNVTGPFQDMKPAEAFANNDTSKPLPTHYSDIAVLAYRLPDGDGAVASPKISNNAGQALDVATLSDGKLTTIVELSRGTREAPTSVVADFGRPQRVRSVNLSLPGSAAMFRGAQFDPKLEVEDAAGGWRKLADMPLDAGLQTTVSFAPVTARRFRVTFDHGGSGFEGGGLGSVPGAVMMPIIPGQGGQAPLTLAELRFSDTDQIDRFEMKAGYGIADDYYGLAASGPAEGQGIAPGSVVDLTSRLGPDGKLDWRPPAGRWKVVRLGYSLTGKMNHPATAEATGLEVDKFDGSAVRAYLEHYIGMFRETTGPDMIGKKGLRAILTDSIEVGASNWTPALLADFQRLRGYDARPWLLTLVGVVVGSRAQSDAFLYDFRRTLADLIASEHYGTVAKVAHEHDLKVYGEAAEDGRPTLGDDMAMRSYADIPMAAMWTYDLTKTPRVGLLGDMKGAASVAHLYGQNIAAAESLTSAFSPWAFAPADLRPVMDLEFAMGINRPVIHTSVHQPVDDKVPGLSLAIFGQYFNRHDTWAGMAKPWVDYMSRSSYMLQQGRYFADVAYFFGEEGPITSMMRDGRLDDVPNRYAYDFVNPDVVLNRLSVEGGDLVAPGGPRYRLLYLGGSSSKLTLPVLRKLATLAEQGATIVGKAPSGSPSLADDATAYAALARQLWSGGPVTNVGRGKVIASNDIEAALQTIGVAPDFAFSGGGTAKDILFVHRRLADGDAYFVTNRKAAATSVEAQFRVTGKRAEIWRADTGLSEPVSYRIEDGKTIVPLEMLPYDSFFVVFRAPANGSGETVTKPSLQPAATIAGPWDVAFQTGRGAPASVQLASLGSFSDNQDPAIRYFSGTSTYTKTFDLPRGTRRGAPLLLDLGKVGDVAEVLVNGKSAGTLWKAPYRIDIGGLVQRGRNRLEVRVANLWVNRLIGDAQPGVTQKYTFTTVPTYMPSAPLRPSGLIGPVTLSTIESR